MTNMKPKHTSYKNIPHTSSISLRVHSLVMNVKQMVTEAVVLNSHRATTGLPESMFAYTRKAVPTVFKKCADTHWNGLKGIS